MKGQRARRDVHLYHSRLRLVRHLRAVRARPRRHDGAHTAPAGSHRLPHPQGSLPAQKYCTRTYGETLIECKVVYTKYCYSRVASQKHVMLIRDGWCCQAHVRGLRSYVSTRPSGATSAELDASLSLMSGMNGGPGPGPGRRSGSLSLDATVVVGCSPHMAAALLAQYTQRRKSVTIAIEMHTCPAHPHPQLQPLTSAPAECAPHPLSQLQPLTSAPIECNPGRPRLTAAASPTPPSFTSASPSACEDPACGTRAGHALELASRTSSVAHRVSYPQLIQIPTLLILTNSITN